MTAQEKKQSLISQMTTAQIVDAFELTNGMTSDNGIATVRGWLMDELETRNKPAFDKWLDDVVSNDTPRKYFEAQA